ncbi:MAG: hypothetical protein KDD70_14565, partial [Bdellovibrionales bacterium]|nr:hypothetical protein [Bdellovibrionales bacterium]
MKSTFHGLGCALLFFAALSGCVSSSNVTESTPALICDPDGCQPNQQRVDSSWGPIKLDGGISIFNLASITSWGDKIAKADEKSTRELKRKIDEIECGPACDKVIQSTASISLSLNPDGMDFEAEECQAAFNSTVEVSASSFSCSLAYIELLGEVNGAADALAEQCKEISPNCGAGSVELNMSSTDEESPVSS